MLLYLKKKKIEMNRIICALIIELFLLWDTQHHFLASQLLFEPITRYRDYYAPHDAYN